MTPGDDTIGASGGKADGIGDWTRAWHVGSEERVTFVGFGATNATIIAHGPGRQERWDAVTGKLIETRPSIGTHSTVYGKHRYVVATATGVQVRDIASDDIVRDIAIPGGATLAVLGASDSRVAAAVQGGGSLNVTVYDVSSGDPLQSIQIPLAPALHQVVGLQLYPDGSRVLVHVDWGSLGNTYVFNVSDGAQLWTTVGAAAVSFDGTKIASGDHVFDAKTFAYLVSTNQPRASSVAWTPDSTRFVANHGGDTTMYTAAGERISTRPSHAYDVLVDSAGNPAIEWDFNGVWLGERRLDMRGQLSVGEGAVAVRDRSTICVYDPDGLAQRCSNVGTSEAAAFAINPAGTLLAISRQGATYVVPSIFTSAPGVSHERASVDEVAWSYSGDRLAVTSGHGVQIYRADLTPVRWFDARVQGQFGDPAFISWRRDDKRIAITNTDGAVIVYDVQTGARLSVAAFAVPHPAKVMRARFSHDGSWLAGELSTSQEVVVARPDGSEQRNYPGFVAAWNPVVNELAVVGTNTGDVVVHDIDADTERSHFTAGGLCSKIEWHAEDRITLGCDNTFVQWRQSTH